MKLTLKIISTALQTLLFILLPFVVFTLITSKTPIFGIQSFIVLTGSMSPKFPVGSIVYSQTTNNLSKLDVITFKNKSGQIITHRIVDIKNNKNSTEFVTKGDANINVDKLLIPQRDVIGKTIFFIPFAGFLANFLKTPLGISALIIFPATAFIAFEIWNIKKEIERQTEKKVLQKLQQV